MTINVPCVCDLPPPTRLGAMPELGCFLPHALQSLPPAVVDETTTNLNAMGQLSKNTGIAKAI